MTKHFGPAGGRNGGVRQRTWVEAGLQGHVWWLVVTLKPPRDDVRAACGGLITACANASEPSQDVPEPYVCWAVGGHR